MINNVHVENYKPNPNWKYPENFEMHPRVDKPKVRSGETRKLNALVKKAKDQGFAIVADLISFEEDTSGTFYIKDMNLLKRISPRFRTVTECVNILPSFLKEY